MHSETNPEVSVVMPVYNGAAFIQKAIDSVLHDQPGIEFELIIGDNCSTDDTIRVVEKYKSDRRVRIYTSEKNVGLYGNLSRLVDFARAPLVKILCADDYMLPGGLRRQVDFMKANPGVGLSRCWGESEDAFKGLRYYEQQLPTVLTASVCPLAFFAFGNLPGSLTNVIYRKSALDNVGGFNLRFPYACDFDMWVRLSSRWGFAFQREPCVYITIHEGQATHFLNRNNELIPQMDVILGGVFVELPKSMQSLCRLHASLVHGVYYANTTIRRFRQGNYAACRPLFAKRTYAYSAPVCIILSLLTLGGRWGYGLTARLILRHISRMLEAHRSC